MKKHMFVAAVAISLAAGSAFAGSVLTTSDGKPVGTEGGVVGVNASTVEAAPAVAPKPVKAAVHKKAAHKAKAKPHHKKKAKAKVKAEAKPAVKAMEAKPPVAETTPAPSSATVPAANTTSTY